MINLQVIALSIVYFVIWPHSLVASAGGDLGQCTTTEFNTKDGGWSGTLSLNVVDDCGLNRTQYEWKIENEALLNITESVILELKFHNFTTKESENLNCYGAEKLDKIEVVETIGIPKAVCRNRANEFTMQFFINQSVREFNYIRFMHNDKTQTDLSFVIEFRFPGYPCDKCLPTELCQHDKCLQSEDQCETLKKAFKCVDNPCDPNPCHNNGDCNIIMDDEPRYNCTCADGYSGTNCEDKICHNKVCQNGGSCSSPTSDICDCPKDVWGDRCETKNDGTYCSPETDSRIRWKETKMGLTDTQLCLGANGTATRECVSMDGMPTWSKPDLSECVSPEFRNISANVDTLMEAEEVTPEAILNITSGISHLIKTKEKEKIYAGDLTVATNTIEKVSKLVRRVDSQKEMLQNIAEGCGNAASSIIDPTTSTVWSFTKKGYIEDKIMSILRSLEQLSLHIAQKTSDINIGKVRAKRAAPDVDSSVIYQIAVPNIEFSIHVLDRARNFSRFTIGNDEDLALTLPEDIFYKALTRTSDAYIHLYTAKFSAVSTLLADTNAIIEQTTVENLTRLINSEILSTRVLNVPEVVFNSLGESVKLTFRLQDTNLSSRLEQSCVFLNMSSNTENTRWLKNGCYRSTEDSNSTHTVCYCTHLTNFAVLMDIYDVENTIDDLDSRILTYFTYAGGAFSVFCCILSVAVFEFFRLRTQRVRIHEQLAVTIILVQLFFLVGIDRTENKIVCMAMAICLHYSLMAMFGWMLIEGAHLYLVLVKVFKSKSYMKIYAAAGWGIPLIIVGISAGLFHDEYGTGQVCWLSKKVLLVAFVPAVGFVIVINTIVLIIVMRIMLNSLSKGSKVSSEERSSIKTSLKAAAILLPILGLTWTFGFLSITSKETLIFTYLFTLLNSLQGVFFFVFHCLLSVDVQNAYDRRNRRKSHKRQTESSFSKKSTMKRDSDFNSSSMFNSTYSRNSIKTATTDVPTLERKISNRKDDFDQPKSVRQSSVDFDDDVFYETSPAVNGSITRRNGTPQVRNIPKRDASSNDGRGVLNNNVRSSSRSGSQSSTQYVIYYGRDNKGYQDLENFTMYDKNELYAKVIK